MLPEGMLVERARAALTAAGKMPQGEAQARAFLNVLAGVKNEPGVFTQKLRELVTVLVTGVDSPAVMGYFEHLIA
ncbi:hypothetical protein KIPB_007988 [Kipferlia bialata]|uniref:Uncharacterized protein n=1 Tax=Kipferlia bialata TaxID=797122 RepID=A0A9K3D261_9EUKA|nr:hypothetical protein KIPB_007988 [Kipferlia bialata]|eukprot:g7988.t1